MEGTLAPTRRKHSRLAAVLGVLLVIILALVLLWDWNWFKPVVEKRASAAIGREVTIGHFDVDLSWKPWITVRNIRIANPPDFKDGSAFAEADRIAVQLELKPLLRGHTVLPAIVVDRPRGDIKPSPAGEPNWRFELPERPPNPEGDLDIGRIEINDGNVHIVEPRYKTDFAIKVRTEQPKEGEAQVVADIDGTYAGQPITGRFVGGSVLTLRDKQAPYPVELKLANGATRIAMKGQLTKPLQFEGANVDLRLEGNDAADFYPLLGLPFPPTPPYTLTGRLDYAQNKVRFTGFDGRLGSSDLGGDIIVTMGGERPHIRMDLKSDRVLLADLAGLIGATPGVEGAPTDSGRQKAQRAKEESKPSVIPDQPINLPKLRAADFDVHYLGKRIEGKTPMDDFDGTLKIVDGKVSVKPLKFGVGEGRIVMNIALDGTGETIHMDTDIDFRRVDLNRLMQATAFDGAGLIGGRAALKSSGNSLKQMLGNGDGDLKLFMNGGNLSALMVDLVGLDIGRALLALLKRPEKADVRCAVSDFGLEDGVLKTRTLLIDTTEANIVGKGWINLKDETLDYELSQQPKKISLASFRGPIEIKGTMKDPSILPDIEDVAARGGAAIALGTLLSPVAALLATIRLGLGEDNDCEQLVTDLRKAAGVPESASAPVKSVPPPKK